jgi:hypothetical protein
LIRPPHEKPWSIRETIAAAKSTTGPIVLEVRFCPLGDYSAIENLSNDANRISPYSLYLLGATELCGVNWLVDAPKEMTEGKSKMHAILLQLHQNAIMKIQFP